MSRPPGRSEITCPSCRSTDISCHGKRSFRNETPKVAALRRLISPHHYKCKSCGYYFAVRLRTAIAARAAGLAIIGVFSLIAVALIVVSILRTLF